MHIVSVFQREEVRRRRWTRHSLHLFTYSFVSASLILMGLFFSGFAVFDKNSLIGQIWLAGPTTIAVGLVLCGKVIIDCRPPDEDADDLPELFMDPEMLMGEPLPNYGGPQLSSKVGVPSPRLPDGAQMPQELEVVNSIDAEYEKKKQAGHILTAAEHLKDLEPCGSSVSETPSEIWSPRVLLPSEVVGSPGICISNPLAVGAPPDSPLLPPRRQGQSLRDHRPRAAKARRPSSNVLYQGETFVLHEMQYLI